MIKYAVFNPTSGAYSYFDQLADAELAAGTIAVDFIHRRGFLLIDVQVDLNGQVKYYDEKKQELWFEILGFTEGLAPLGQEAQLNPDWDLRERLLFTEQHDFLKSLTVGQQYALELSPAHIFASRDQAIAELSFIVYHSFCHACHDKPISQFDQADDGFQTWSGQSSEIDLSNFFSLVQQIITDRCTVNNNI